MPRIDIGAVLAEKAPRLARWVPGFVLRWLRRTIHEPEINYILEHYWNLPPQEFIRACFREWQVTYSVEGLEKLDPKGRYLFASNHPFGGMDGMMLADKLIDRFGDARVVVNDLLMHVEPLQPIWLPVNKHGRQTAAYARRYDEAFAGDLPILTFPAGLCSRRRGGVVSDTPWRLNFIKRAHASGRKIVPLYVEGRLSDFFYRIARLRERLGIKLNVEMLWLPDEMFRQGGSRFRIVAGDPIAPDGLRGTLRQQADTVDRLIRELGADTIPCIRVYNKSDLSFPGDRAKEEDAVAISAKTGEGIPDLLALIDKKLDKGTKRVTLHLPYDKAGALDSLYREAKVESVEYAATVDVVAVCNPRLLGQLKDYIEGWQPPKEEWE